MNEEYEHLLVKKHPTGADYDECDCLECYEEYLQQKQADEA